MIEFPLRAPEVNYIRKCKLSRIIDGDTFEVILDHGCKLKSEDMMIRLWQVNTPETKGSEKVAGLYVEKQVTELFKDDSVITIDSKAYKTDSFERLICLLWVDGICINQWLLQNRYAWPTDARGRMLVPRNVQDLNLPYAVKQAVGEAQL